MLRFVLFTAATTTLLSSAAARDLFVNNTAGDDTFSGEMADTHTGGEGPVRTLAKALRLATPGDRISMANTGQPYRECVALEGGQHSGDGVLPFIVEGNGATLDGSAAVPTRSWELVDDDLFRFRPRRLAYHLVFDGPHRLDRVSVSPSTWPAAKTLKPGQWTLCRGHVYTRLPERSLPSDRAITHTAHAVGITLHRVRDVVISNLRVRGYQLDGISLPDGVRNCLLADVVSEENGRCGVAVAGTSHADLFRCTLRHNGVVQVLASGRSRVLVEKAQFDPDDGAPVDEDGGRVRVIP